MKNSFRRYALIAAAAVIVLAVGCFLLFRPASTVNYEENLLVNGSFDRLDSKGLPEGWTLDAYSGLTGAEFDVVRDENGCAAHIVNKIPKDARFAQEVNVEPDTLYRLSGYIKADAQDGRGANLSIKDIYLFTDEIYDTGGEWVEAVLYGRTGLEQHTVTIYVRLGGYSGEATGEAWFRDVSLCKVDGVPSGYSAPLWSSAVSASDSDEAEGTASMLLVFSCIAYLGLFMLLCRSLLRPRLLEGWRRVWTKEWTAAALLFLAFVLRVVIAALVPGYDVDIGCFRAWGIKMASSGPAGFYPAGDPFSFCDYPPGYMWVLWLLGLLGNLLGTGLTEFMVKLPPIFADLAMCAVLYRLGKKRLPEAAALAVALLYAFNPLIIAVGSAWGQADALTALLLMLSVLFAVRRNWKAALPLYMASVLFKPQALMFGPLGLLALTVDFLRALRDEKDGKARMKNMGLGLLFTVAAGLAIALPFSLHQQWDWLITLYGKTMGRYGYATVNSCNLYFLLGQNWVSAENGISGNFAVCCLTFCLAVLPLAAAWLAHFWKGGLKNALLDRQNRPRLYVLGGMGLALALVILALDMVGSLTYFSLGTVMIVYCVAVIGALYVFSGDAADLPVFGAALLLLLFNTGSMMHERYLFPAVALLLLGYLLKKDVRVLWLAVGVTVAGFLNVGCVLDRNIRIGGAAGHLDAPAVSISSDTAILEYLSAVLNMAVGFAALWLVSAISRGGQRELGPQVRPVPAPCRAVISRKMTLRDWIILSCITVVYSVITFTNLGSTKAPQTAFVSQSPDEQIVLDLGEERTFNMLYYGGIHQYQSDFTVEFSRDGGQYNQSYTADMPVGDCFKWKYLSLSPGGFPETVTARYVRITANSYNLTLFEVLFQDAETDEILPAVLVSDLMKKEVEVIDPATGEPWINEATGQPVTHRQMAEAGNETAAFLVDEPDSMEGDFPSWYNSTYFDEIYHARTAYEHLHQLQPYEYTHPPLGKVMMSWAIAIFGMTPFGWRFAGALAGVLMLPGMYLLGKLLIKRSWGGMACCALLALDLMHFTQTRIATIDSFVVLWIIWMVYFMLRWFFQEPFMKPLWKSLIPLALSGLCMGLGVASKWTGCYAGVVLALIFFWGVVRRWRLVRAAKTIPEKTRTAEEAAEAEGGKYLLITVASCLVFFVLVPALVYYCSYIPFFAYDGAGVSVKKIIQEAERMLSYHSTPGLGMDHAFYSPWYEWPVIAKPMYYASNSFEPTGYHTTISAMGNPAVWWVGLGCILCLCGVWIRRHLQKDLAPTLWAEKDDPRIALTLLCYFVQLLPWMLVPRGTYIYHYFPCVPFLIAAIALSLDLLADTGHASGEAQPGAVQDAAALSRVKRSERAAMGLLAAVLIAAAVLFVAFFPYASGCLTPQSWLDAMRWFDRWLWY